jgi:cell division septation protein DedD
MRALTRISALIASLVVAATAGAQPQYQIFDIGVVQVGDTASQGFGSSPGGVAVGRSITSNSASQAFTWTLFSGRVGLPNLAGRPHAVSNDAHDNGIVVGTAATTLFGSSRLPVVWTNGVVTQLPLPGGETLGDANGVNGSSVAVGSVDGGSNQQAVIYNGASATIITQTTPDGSFFITAFGINNSGRIVGQGIDPNDAARNVGIVYDMGRPAAFEVGALPGANGALNFGVGNGGHVVGSSMMNQGSGMPFIWSQAHGIMAIPLAAGTSEGSARAVNTQGWVVGQDSSAFSIPFLWDGTTTYRLADLLAPGSGWDLSTNTSSSALGISDNGVIVGTGVHNGETHAFAMVPAGPTPSPTPCGLIIAFSESFDGVIAPALPAGWTTSFTPGPANCTPTGTCALGTNWATSTTAPDTAPNCAFHNAPGCVTDSTLDTPSFLSGPTNGTFLSLRHSYDLENGLDGAVLEISINGGPFVDFVAAGGGALYNGTISSGTFSPIAGRSAWTGNSGGYVTTFAQMPLSAANQNVRLRFRLATDCSGAGTGWRIDTITVTDNIGCQNMSPTPTPSPTPAVTPTPVPCVITSLSEDFDTVTPPDLPAGWASSFTPGPAFCAPGGTCGSGTNWASNAALPYLGPNSAFHDAPGCVTDSNLDTPSFAGVSGSSLIFQNNFDLESGLDGGVLEISINGGPFIDFIVAGGSFMSGGYNGTISAAFHSPIAGRAAWTGNSGGYTGTTAMIPPAAWGGQNVVLRFRLATDCSGSSPGWRIDNVRVQFAIPCATPTPSPSPTLTPPPTPTPPPTTPTPTATPSPTPTLTPTASPPPTPSPTPTPVAQALNLSTRMRVQTGENVGIGGFIITGTTPKHVLLRALGPSLTQSGVPNVLADPVMELHGPGAFVTITDDNWRDDPAQEALIIASGIPPINNLESAIDATLTSGSYTAIVSGKNNTSGIGLVEVYDLSHAVDSKLANISTRAFVGTGDSVVIAGFILGGNSGADRVVLRGIGPSLPAAGVADALADPTLELRDGDGALLASNNDWQDDPTQAAALTAAGLAPTNNLESGIAATLSPGLYTALLAGLNHGIGVGLVEVYDLGAP